MDSNSSLNLNTNISLSLENEIDRTHDSGGESVQVTAFGQPILVSSEGINSFFLLTMGMIVFLMQCGFAFLEAGSVRSRNTTNILIKNLLDSGISAMAYWSVGWALAYGGNGNVFCGSGDWFAIGMDPHQNALWFFQFVFAATASTIVSGALAERCEFSAYIIYSAALSAVIYPIVTHWAWHPSGWLSIGSTGSVRYTDFAGSGVVHLLGGVSALVAAIILGPRIGRFDNRTGPDNMPICLQGHSVPFAAMGGFLLMFGFFAFNGGSQLSITEPNDGPVVALAMMNTMLSGGCAAITTLCVNKLFIHKKWSLLLCINGALTGMVCACAGCDRLYPWAAVVLGLGAAVAYLTVSKLVECCRVDDPLDAVAGSSFSYYAVHAGGGLWGLFATPFLLKDTGIVYVADVDSFMVLAWNMAGAGAIIGWAVLTIGPIFLLLRLFKVLRVAEEVELKGLDVYKHGEPAYPLGAYGHGWDEADMNFGAPLQSPASMNGGGRVAVNYGFRNQSYGLPLASISERDSAISSPSAPVSRHALNNNNKIETRQEMFESAEMHALSNSGMYAGENAWSRMSAKARQSLRTAGLPPSPPANPPPLLNHSRF